MFFQQAVAVSMATILLMVLPMQTSALRCWQCSSDIDVTCRDHFNATQILNGGRNGIYDNFQQNYNNQNNQYNGQYGQSGQTGQYNPNNQNSRFNQNQQQNRGQYDQNYNPNYPGQRNSFNRQNPVLQECNEEDARLNRMKNVCVKKVTKTASSTINIIRQCKMVAFDAVVSTCNDPVSRGISLEFCEYCDYDGCNAATSLKTNNILMAVLVPLFVALLCLRQ